MIGDEFSRQVEGRVEGFAADVEAYSASRGLPSPSVRVIDQYLNMGDGELASYDDVELAEIAVEVARYAYYLQDEANKKQVIINKCTHEINKIAYPRIGRHPEAFRTEDKLLLATLDDRVARTLHDQRANAQAYAARWGWLGQRASDLASKIESLSYRKGKSHGKN